MFIRCGGLGLSQEFAEQRFDDLMVMFGGTNPACNGIEEAAFNSDFPTPAFIDSQIQSLITTCEADRSRYQSVKDCNKLLDFCVYSAKYSGSQGCKNYINGVIKGIYRLDRETTTAGVTLPGNTDRGTATRPSISLSFFVSVYLGVIAYSIEYS
ncbi:uncharacterized protein LOC101854625 [Aplysia californica]|uniref:Uncharacterized protein LOC101854625 n=1 Tax=Aplysia californica TaxID=6500 RepID=A0ABM0ZUH7_APLCA|nr:uncharacterized protein LOC101854625 [Aplysia californica]